jgi:hypothetical protein
MINVEQFVRTVVAKVEGFDVAEAEQFYETYFGSPRSITIAEFHDKLNQDSPYAEVVDGLRTFTERGYSKTYEGELTKNEFLSLFSDMYAASPEVYSTVVSRLWT